eukprot:TRINITY_DN13284_c0_g1_i3.p1 TRINITY_DN13284_c0_g1~~TRINITY_DN13284_c0_g1_i3.p1  ORF type:complete len:166 (-),score=25.51 TRINITY_DN13284_c0_g1_i3:164-661(-)
MQKRKNQQNKLIYSQLQQLLVKNLFQNQFYKMPKKQIKKTKLLWEKELLGLYISDHPMQEFEQDLEGNVASMADIKEGKFKQAIVAGVITNIKKITTKNNDMMAFVNIEDMYGQSAELIIFPNLYKKANTILEKDRPIISFGALSDKDGEPKILSDVIYLSLIHI